MSRLRSILWSLMAVFAFAVSGLAQDPVAPSANPIIPPVAPVAPGATAPAASAAAAPVGTPTTPFRLNIGLEGTGESGEVSVALHVQEPVRIVIEQERKHGLGEEMRLQSGRWLVGCRQPLAQMLPTVWRDPVTLAVGASARLFTQGLDVSIADHPRDGRVDLPKGNGPLRAKAGVVAVLEVIAM